MTMQRTMVHISINTVGRLNQSENVNEDVLVHICAAPDCRNEEIVPENK